MCLVICVYGRFLFENHKYKYFSCTDLCQQVSTLQMQVTPSLRVGQGQSCTDSAFKDEDGFQPLQNLWVKSFAKVCLPFDGS